MVVVRVVPPSQSQGRGHGEGGGVQYQTLNSEIAHILGREVGAELRSDLNSTDAYFATKN